MENKNCKEGLYMVKIEKVVTFTPSEGDIQTHAETEVYHILVKNFENFEIFLTGVNKTPEVVGLTYQKIDGQVLIL